MGGLRSSGWLLLACAALVRADTWFFANANDSPVKYNGGDWKFEGTTIATYSEQASFQIEFKGASIAGRKASDDCRGRRLLPARDLGRVRRLVLHH
jgi:hypothetical protein